MNEIEDKGIAGAFQIVRVKRWRWLLSLLCRFKRATKQVRVYKLDEATALGTMAVIVYEVSGSISDLTNLTYLTISTSTTTRSRR